MPNGSLLKQYRPDGVMNVVSKRDAGERGICQKPLFASSLLNSLVSTIKPCPLKNHVTADLKECVEFTHDSGIDTAFFFRGISGGQHRLCLLAQTI